MSFPHFNVFIFWWRMAEQNLLFKFLKFYDKKHFVPLHWEAILETTSHLKICFLLTFFHKMLPCHKFFIKQKIKKSYGHERVLDTVLDLLVYSKSPIKWILDQRYKTPALTLDIYRSWWWHVMFWHCTFCIAVNTVWNNSKTCTFRSIAWVLSHAKYPARICLLHLG